MMLLVLLLVAPAAWARAEPGYYVVTLVPGHKWDKSLPLDRQPGMKAHRHYLSRLHDEDVVVIAGRLVGTDSEMLVLRTESRAEADRVVAGDPAVVSRIFAAKVTGWRVEMSSIPHYRRVVPKVQIPKKPFKVQSIGLDAPIRLTSGSGN